MTHRKGRDYRSGWLLVAAGLILSGCATIAEPEATHDDPLTVEAIEGSEGLNRLTITQQASDRLDISTGEVTVEKVSHSGGPSQERKVVPYSSVMYDPEGGTWVYTNPEPLVFERAAITVDFIDGDIAALLKGPAEGTSVVIVGSAELYGAEFGVDK